MNGGRSAGAVAGSSAPVPRSRLACALGSAPPSSAGFTADEGSSGSAGVGCVGASISCNRLAKISNGVPVADGGGLCGVDGAVDADSDSGAGAVAEADSATGSAVAVVATADAHVDANGADASHAPADGTTARAGCACAGDPVDETNPAVGSAANVVPVAEPDATGAEVPEAGADAIAAAASAADAAVTSRGPPPDV